MLVYCGGHFDCYSDPNTINMGNAVTNSSVYQMIAPTDTQRLPLLLDSPHSGDIFPQGFSPTPPRAVLQTAWDGFVDDLWSGVVGDGGTLVHALFPRVYIDPNRAPDDIDPDDINGTLSFRPDPSVYSARGMGLIRRMALPDLPMYEKPPTAKDVEQRIQNYYRPYHRQISDQLDDMQQTFGGVWHINCHSMKSRGNAMNIDSGETRADIVLGDLCGTSCEASFIATIEQAFRERGYKVVRNTPYQGGYMVRLHGQPKVNRHSLQIEINRAIYMNERAFEKNENYTCVKKHLGEISALIAHYVKSRISA